MIHILPSSSQVNEHHYHYYHQNDKLQLYRNLDHSKTVLFGRRHHPSGSLHYQVKYVFFIYATQVIEVARK